MDNHYQDKYDEFTRNLHNNMFIFEVEKLCGYSTFVTIYKNQTIIENIKTDEAKPDLIDYSQYFAQMINYNSAIYDLLSNKLRVTVVS